MITLKPNSAGSFTPAEEASILHQLLLGEVIVYPTDTLYGLGADACSDTGVEKIYLLKQRQDSPVSVLASQVEELLSMAYGLTEKGTSLIQHFLPGALTVICHSRYPFARKLISNTGTVGFRVPKDDISTRIAALLGHPITTTSVNPAGNEPASSLIEVEGYYGKDIPLMIDKGLLPPSKGSTVIDLTTEPFRILREGEITRQQLAEFLN